MPRHPEYQYLDLLTDIMENGYEKPVFGNEVTTRNVFGRQIRFDLSKGFPLLTTKKVFSKGIIHELIWFLSGSGNIKYLIDNGVHIWDEWGYKIYRKAAEKGEVPTITQEEYVAQMKADVDFAVKWGELGPVYGVQWRGWPASDGRKIDQLAWAIDKLRKYPERRHVIVSAWNPEFMYEMAAPGKSVVLAPCHTMFNFNVLGNKLSCQLYQRSADMFLGVPFNIASYALLTMMVAQVCGYEVGDFVHTFGDAHIYSNHFDAVAEQLKREPRPFPTLKLNPDIKNIDDFRYEDITIENYDPHPSLKAEVALVGGFKEEDRKDYTKKS